MSDIPQAEGPVIQPVQEETDVREMLKETLELERENNVLLKRMQKIGRIAFWSKVAIYAVLIGLPLLLIAPLMSYLGTLTGGAPSDQNILNSTLFGVPTPETIKTLLGE
ncbi:MAG: hypothetical protein KBC16_03650 [Candidatus Pacebacteria bacterium]|nr:hypothetical protein [Candidatus Paceibacterota bacterium]